jgi:hypothetical protein
VRRRSSNSGYSENTDRRRSKVGVLTPRRHLTERNLSQLLFVDADPDAAAFLLAASLSDPIIVEAVNQLTLDMKDAGIWSKMKCVYPFVGDSASTHKWNLKDPRDLDAAFRLTFSGSGTHSANGYQPAGVGHASTHFIASAHLPANSSHQSYYSRTDSTESAYIMGSYDAAAPRQHLAVYGYTMYYGQNDNATLNTTVAGSHGLLVGSRYDSDSVGAYRNGVLLVDGLSAYTAHNAIANFIGALNYYGSAFQNTSRQCAFASLGEGLTPSENTDLYAAVQTFQTTLGRQV